MIIIHEVITQVKLRLFQQCQRLYQHGAMRLFLEEYKFSITYCLVITTVYSETHQNKIAHNTKKITRTVQGSPSASMMNTAEQTSKTLMECTAQSYDLVISGIMRL